VHRRQLLIFSFLIVFLSISFLAPILQIKLFAQNDPAWNNVESWNFRTPGWNNVESWSFSANATAIQYYSVTFTQTGLSSDANIVVLTVDSDIYLDYTSLPITFTWQIGTQHTFSFASPVSSSITGKQYVWMNSSGLSTLQSGTVPVQNGTISGNYAVEYYLTVTSPYGSPSPPSGWFLSGSITEEVVTSPSNGYTCTGWTGTGSVPASGTGTSVTFTIAQPSSITWNWQLTLQWFTVETWTFKAQTAQSWRTVESWSFSSTNSWTTVETWGFSGNSTAIVNYSWFNVETWNLNAYALSWHNVEAWNFSTVNSWTTVETWHISASTITWNLVETWSFNATASVGWHLFQNWTFGNYQPGWNTVEVWVIASGHIAAWNNVESWAISTLGNGTLPWVNVESWNFATVSTTTPIFIIPPNSLSETFYMRSDTHTTLAQLGFILDTTNTQGAGQIEQQVYSGTGTVTFGVRVWLLNWDNSTNELTSGVPVATVLSSGGSGLQIGYWTCPGYSGFDLVVNAFMVCVYEQFNGGAWTLVGTYVSNPQINIKFPLGTWTFNYYVNVSTSGGNTYATFNWGDSATPTAILLYYQLPSNWETQVTSLFSFDIVGFIMTPFQIAGVPINILYLFFLLCIVIAMYERQEDIVPLGLFLLMFMTSGGVIMAMIPLGFTQVGFLLAAFVVCLVLYRLIKGKGYTET